MMEERPRILYLDDEENNLMAFKALFRREYDIFTTTSAADAVAYLNQHEVPLILSDQKMPDISGAEFFELTLADFPHAVRILVTGYADMEAVIDAINKGHVYRYVTKPWDENDFRITLQNAFEKWRSEKELRSKSEALEKTVGELEKFIYTISHDLRNPVLDIQSLGKQALNENLGEKAQYYFSAIEEKSNKLDSFLQNLIYYYQNLRGDERMTEIDLNRLFDQLIEKYSIIENAPSVKVIKEINLTEKFVSDEERLSMILGNLLSNAFRFRDKGKDLNEIQIHAFPVGDRAVIRITDNGIGIKPEALTHIFDMSFQSSSTSNSSSGVGLFLAKEAARRLQAKISATSDTINGTRFTLDILNRVKD